MTIETMRQLSELLLPKTIEQVIIEEIDPDFQWDYSARSLGMMIENMLDIVKLVMRIEEIYGAEIPDFFADQIMDSDPQPMMISYWRDKRLGELGI